MTRRDKLVERFRRRPKDFTWAEMCRLLESLGYEMVERGRTGGSRRRFLHPTAPVISLHEPHPSKVVKRYVISEVLDALAKEGLI